MNTPTANPPEPVEPAPVVESDWKTWSPYQSPAVRNICAHLTPAERSAVMGRGMMYGVWIVATVALPLQFILLGLLRENLSVPVVVIGGLLIIVHILCIPVWQRRQREFLCNTAWARENHMEPESLKLFNWR